MRKGRAPEVRSLIRKTTAKLIRKGTTAEEIAIACEQEHRKQFVAETPDLWRIAGIKLASDELSRAGRRKLTDQLELFEEYAIPTTLTLRVDDAKGVRLVHKSTATVTIGEIRQYIADHSKPREPRPDELKGLGRLVNDAEKLGTSDEVTVTDFWSKKQAGKVKSGAASATFASHPS